MKLFSFLKDNTGQSEEERVNRTVYFCYLIEVIVIFFAYVVEVIKGSRTLPYFLMMTLVIVVPAVILFLSLKKNVESDKFRYLVVGLFGIMYTFAIFTTKSKLAFTYAMPMMLAIIMYNSVKLSLLADTCAIVLNVIQVIVYAVKNGGIKAGETADAEIQIIILIFIMGYSILANRSANFGNKDKIAKVEAEQEKTANLLDHIMFVSKVITKGIFAVNG